MPQPGARSHPPRPDYKGMQWRLTDGAAHAVLEPDSVTEMQTPGWSGRFERLAFGGGLYMHLGRLEVTKPSSIAVQGGPGSASLSAFCFTAGKGTLRVQGAGPIPLHPRVAHFFMIRDRSGTYELPAPQTVRFFSIAFNVETLISLHESLPERLLPFIEPEGPNAIVLHTALAASTRRMVQRLGDPQECTPLERLRREAVSLEFLADILRSLEHGASEPRPPCLTEREASLVGKARALMCADLTDPPSVSEVADRVGLSLRKLLSGFREIHGDTPGQLLRNERLERARLLLEAEDLPLKAIAGRVGYRHATNFVHAFTKRFGVSPRRFIRRQRKDR
jgi:AraC-like DNA-binding protein